MVLCTVSWIPNHFQFCTILTLNMKLENIVDEILDQTVIRTLPNMFLKNYSTNYKYTKTALKLTSNKMRTYHKMTRLIED